MPTPMLITVMVLTEREMPSKLTPGVVFHGEILVDIAMGQETLTRATLRALRSKGITNIQDGDYMFFPKAAAGHRMAKVLGYSAYRLEKV